MRKELHKWAALPLRLVIGFGFLYHGWPKVFSTSGHESFVGTLQSLGMPAANLTAWFVGILEVVGGLALIVGAFTAVVSGLLIIEMLVAMFAVHLPHGFSFINITGMSEAGPQFGMPGFEVNLLYIAGLLAIFLRSPTYLSVDERLARTRARRGTRSVTHPPEGEGRAPETDVSARRPELSEIGQR
jgi:putative oxidoreductase